jgi:hypothetical protein
MNVAGGRASVQRAGRRALFVVGLPTRGFSGREQREEILRGVCPMRCARTVAWSSTAGFHQGLRWMT